MILLISQGGSVYDAWRKARIWRNVSLVFIAYEVVEIAVVAFIDGCTFWCEPNYYMLEKNVYLLWRLGLLLIVNYYIAEIETAAVSFRVGGAQAG